MLYLGIKIVTETVCQAKDLKENYDAIILAIGANTSCKMSIPGENLPNVFRSKRAIRIWQASEL